MIEPAIRQILLASNDVLAAVEDRIYFVIAPQGERRTRIVLQLVTSVPGFTFEGRGGYVNGRIQVTSLAPTYQEAKELTAAVRLALDGFSGTADDTDIAFIETENVRDIPAAPLEGRATPTFGVAVDATFMHME